MIKKLSFNLYFICFFGFIVYAYGSQLKNTFENQLLSSIYSEYNNDYLIWEKLPKYNFSNDHTSTLLSNIIIGNYTFDNISEIESGFIHEIVLFLKNLGDDKCLNIPDKKQIYIFEEAILKSINFWMTFCNKHNVQNNLENLNEIDSRFTNLRYINTIFYYHHQNDLNNLKKINEEITSNKETLSIFNSKELNVMDSIFNYHNINFPLSDFIKSSTTFNNLSIELDQNYVVKDYEDIIYLQLFQTSNYYFYAREYKKALALLSYLIEINPDNRDYYLYKKISFLAELNPSKEILKLIKNFNPTDKNFNFFKNYLYISTSFELDTDMSDLVYFINNSDHQTDWINLELSFLVAMEMYFLNDNSGALDFINECCMSILENSDDAIHLFKYGILLERNNEIKKAEEIIQKSIDISKSSYPYILNYLAYLWVENDRKLDLAESMLQKAVKDSNYNDGAILDSLGWLYFKKDNLDLAEKWIYDAYQLEPSEPEIIDHLSQIYYELGRYKESKFLDNKIILFHKDYFKYEEVLGRNENK